MELRKVSSLESQTSEVRGPALLAVLRWLDRIGCDFVTPTPATHERVLRRDAQLSGHPVLDPSRLYFGEIRLNASGQLVTSGLYGWTLVVTGAAATIAQAMAAAYDRVRAINIPNVRCRHDIGDRLLGGQLAELERLGFLDAPQPQRVRTA